MDDDGIVVRMGRMSVASYLSGAETMRRRELVWGVVREPPAPFYDHQAVVTRLTVLLDAHVRAYDLGRVCVSPVDVILDTDRALVVQPDVIFVSHERREIVRDRVWGAPDLVVEVTSRGTVWRDRNDKRRWYRRYGVREYWLVDPPEKRVEVVVLGPGRSKRRVYRRTRRIESVVLHGIEIPAADVFEV